MLESIGCGLLRLKMTDRSGGQPRIRITDCLGDWSALCGRDIDVRTPASELSLLFGDSLLRSCVQALELGKTVSTDHHNSQTGRWYQIDVQPLDVRRQEVGLAVRDVSARREREMELQESRLRYRALADGLPMPVWVLTPELKVQYVNRFFDRFFGPSTAKGGVVWEQLIHPEDYQNFMDGLLDSIQFRRSFQIQVRGRRNDGFWRWLDMVATPRHSTSGRFLGLACSMRDITDQRELEEAREQLLDAERAARTEAETNIRIKDEFLAMISHELRTPLTTVVGWGEMLLQRMDKDDRNYRGMSVIVSSTHALRQLINDMLDLGGMLVGKLQLSMQPLDMCAEVRDAVQSLEAQAGESGVRIQLELPNGSCPVHGDRTRLQQVMWNLLSNALKFSDSTSDRWIRVALDIGTDSCQLLVQDNGVGIPLEFQPYLFTRFRQADSTTTRRFGGMGLGLSIVQNIVEMHGGQVKAYSAGVGHGAMFTVILPLMERVCDGLARPTCIEERALPQAVGTDSQALKDRVLLLVDDQQPILDYLRLALERHGATVLTCTSPTEVLRLLSSSQGQCCDLVISDIGMPVMDGYTLARSIREKLLLDAGQLPMIALTALSRPSDCERAKASGFQHVVPKPCNLAELMAAICQCFAAVSGAVEGKR